MKLTTTLNRIWSVKAAHFRKDGWISLIYYLGPDFDDDHNKEINLLTILESNGVMDCLWSLQATIQDSKKTAVRLAVELAKSLIYLHEYYHPNDRHPRKVLESAERWLKNPNNDENEKIIAFPDEYFFKGSHASAIAAATFTEYATSNTASIRHAVFAAQYSARFTLLYLGSEDRTATVIRKYLTL